MNTKYLYLGLLPLMATSGMAATDSPEAETRKNERPNILFILSDDHTSQAWGIYGGILAEYAQNRNIRRLAEEGVTLDNCFCTNSISTPSRAAILTGRYSHRNGVYTLEDTLDTALPTIATALQASGYHTGLVGKWHPEVATRKGSTTTPYSTTRANIATPPSRTAMSPGRVTGTSANVYTASQLTSSPKKPLHG